jgi:hypothetical protein
MNGLLLASGTLWFERSPERVGPAPDALASHHLLASGILAGSMIPMLVAQSGGEWLTLRGDGIAIVEGRHALRLAAQEFVFARVSGLYDLGEEGFERGLHGDGLQGTARAELSVRFHTASPSYCWLNRLQCLVLGERDFTNCSLTVDIYGFGQYAAFVAEQQESA